MGHPYWPSTLKLEGYVEPAMPFQQVLAWFFGTCALFFALTWFISGRFKHLTLADRITTSWFAMTGIVHFIIEGYVVLHPEFYKDSSGSILAEIWKEYTKADSRYATRDAFVISMEAITAFAEGPACFAVVYGMLMRRPWVFTMQILVSAGQMYGDILYFATSVLEGLVHSRPEALYFWFYFVIVNGVWIVVPAIVLTKAAGRISVAVAQTSNRPAATKYL